MCYATLDDITFLTHYKVWHEKTRLKKYVNFYWKTLEYVSYNVQNPLEQCKRGFHFVMQRLKVSEKYIAQ